MAAEGYEENVYGPELACPDCPGDHVRGWWVHARECPRLDTCGQFDPFVDPPWHSLKDLFDGDPDYMDKHFAEMHQIGGSGS